jgi:hypothetical protein
VGGKEGFVFVLMGGWEEGAESSVYVLMVRGEMG